MKSSNHLWIAGIHTDVGKTVVAGLITRALQAEYWKPVQAGSLENSDSMRVHKMLQGTELKVHPEAFRLSQPMSPHAAAAIDSVHISMDDLQKPATTSPLVIETAGGIYSPLSDEHTMLDLMLKWPAPIVLVGRHYIGSINHTLLTIQALEQRGAHIAGIIFSDEPNEMSTSFIQRKFPKYPVHHIGHLEEHDPSTFATAAEALSHILPLWIR